jgi:hypothetical protein
MKGKRRANPKYFDDDLRDENSTILPYVTHLIELLSLTRGSPKLPPPRHLCPINVALRVAGVQIQESLVWSALMIADQATSADIFGYGQAHLQAYAIALLIDYNICPTLDNVNQLVSYVSQQLDFSRAATLIPEETSLMEKGKYRKFQPSFLALILDETSGYNDKFMWNAWAPDDTIKRFCDDLAREHHMNGSSRLSVEFQLLSSAIAHRQKFLDANPHINTGIQRIFRKAEVKQTPEVRSQKVLERIARLHKMRMARRCFRHLDNPSDSKPTTLVPHPRDPSDVEESDPEHESDNGCRGDESNDMDD